MFKQGEEPHFYRESRCHFNLSLHRPIEGLQTPWSTPTVLFKKKQGHGIKHPLGTPYPCPWLISYAQSVSWNTYKPLHIFVVSWPSIQRIKHMSIELRRYSNLFESSAFVRISAIWSSVFTYYRDMTFSSSPNHEWSDDGYQYAWS